MYWWNVSKLGEDLREGRVDEKERFKYYLASVIAWTLGAQPFLYYGQSFKITDLVSACLALTITIVGTVMCYRVNRSGDNQDFIGRMVCLAWPIGIKLLVLFIAVLLPILIFVDVATWGAGSEVSTAKGERAEDIATVIWGLTFLLVFYWMLYKYVGLVAQVKTAEDTN
jgi:hypothetical protein